MFALALLLRNEFTVPVPSWDRENSVLPELFPNSTFSLTEMSGRPEPNVASEMPFNEQFWCDYFLTRILGRRVRPLRGRLCARQGALEMRVCWSLGAGLRKQASNHHKRLWSRAMVVSVMEKAKPDFVR